MPLGTLAAHLAVLLAPPELAAQLNVTAKPLHRATSHVLTQSANTTTSSYLIPKQPAALDWMRNHLMPNLPTAAWRNASWQSPMHRNCLRLFASPPARNLTVTVLGGSASARVDGYGKLLGDALRHMSGGRIEVLNPSHGFSGRYL